MALQILSLAAPMYVGYYLYIRFIFYFFSNGTFLFSGLPTLPHAEATVQVAWGGRCLTLDVSLTWCNSEKKKRRDSPFCSKLIFPHPYLSSYFSSACDIFFFLSLGLVCWSKLLSQRRRRRRRRHRWPPEFEGVLLPKVKRRDICFFPFVWLFLSSKFWGRSWRLNRSSDWDIGRKMCFVLFWFFFWDLKI